MTQTILVTGATGTVGNEVIKQLTNKSVSIRAGVRSPEKAKEYGWNNAAVTVFDYDKPETFETALTGVDKVFLVAPPLAADAPERMIPMIRKAVELGVKGIVNLSAMGVELDDNIPLRQVEIALEKSGLDYTLLRPNWFMQNCNTFMLGSIREQQAIFVPAADSKTAFIDTRDIAAVAVEALTSDAHHQKAYTLTGGEAFDHYHMAEVLSNVSGKKISYRAIDDEALRGGMKAQNTPEPAIDYFSMLYDFVRKGVYAVVTPDVETVLGRKPISFKQYAEDYKESWS
jgi:uncharacterized protein YbjT (DUF2867 family)